MPPAETPSRRRSKRRRWRTEYDVVRCLERSATRCTRSASAASSTRSGARCASTSRTSSFNLLEGFDDVAHFDQNVVGYLELLKMKYTGCNARGLLLGARQGADQEAPHLPPHPRRRVRGRRRADDASAARASSASRSSSSRSTSTPRSASRRPRSSRATRSCRSASASSTRASAPTRWSRATSRAASSTSASSATSGCKALPIWELLLRRRCRRRRARSPPSA